MSPIEQASFPIGGATEQDYERPRVTDRNFQPYLILAGLQVESIFNCHRTYRRCFLLLSLKCLSAGLSNVTQRNRNVTQNKIK